MTELEQTTTEEKFTTEEEQPEEQPEDQIESVKQPDEVEEDEQPPIKQVEEEEDQITETNDDEEIKYIRDPILDTEEMKKIFVGGITPETKDEELKEFFETISGGNVTDHVIIRKDGDKKSHFGFVTFETSELVDEVLYKKKELNFHNRLLDVNRAVPKNNSSTGAHDKAKKLFVANLPKFNCSEDDLLKYFRARHPPKYGVIESVQLIKKKDDKGNMTDENKGYGFVVVSSEDMADKMAIQHATFEFGGRKIELKKSVPTGNTTGGSGRGGRGARGSNRGGRGASQNVGYGPPGYYGGYGAWDGYGYGGYDAYGGYATGYGGYGGYGPQRGGRGGGRYHPY